MKALNLAAALLIAGAVPACAQDSVNNAPPPETYQKVAALVPLPEFLPGLGELYVDPKTLPAGPFLAYDHDRKLVSTIYMIPVEDLNPDKSFDDLVAPGGNVDHVDIYFNAGHPGVEKPHAHIVLWHEADGEARVAQ
jgi:hypothetical protein